MLSFRRAGAALFLALSFLTASCRSGADARAPLAALDCENPTIIHATLYVEPGAAPMQDTTISMRGGTIARVASGAPAGDSRCVLDVKGRVVLAGFWNTHVHFTHPKFADLATAEPLVRSMLLQYGFTSVVDTGADPSVLMPLRDAIRAGKIPGPRIVIAGGGFVGKDGTPAYLPPDVLPELVTPEEAEPAVNAVLDGGAEGIKIFSGSFQTPDHTIYLQPAIIEQVTRAAHARGAFVVSHPTDRTGLVNAVEGGVDVLAHVAPPAGRLGPNLIARMKERHVALIPTLKLWRWELRRHAVAPDIIESFEHAGVQQVHDYHQAGGEVLFGTDVGYMTDYDTRDEFRLMNRAGLDFAAILATLTTHPARYFTGSSGTVRPGEAADLVILAGDPAKNVGALSEVAMTIRGGRVVYRESR